MMGLFNGRRRVEKNLTRIEGEEKEKNIHALAKHLSDSSDEVVAKALKALSNLAKRGYHYDIVREDIVGKIIILIKSEDPEIRKYAVRTISWLTAKKGPEVITSNGGIKPLLDCLESDDPTMIKYATSSVYILSKKGFTEHIVYADGITKLGKALLTADDNTRVSIIDILAAIARNGYGAEIVRSGVARIILMLRNQGNTRLKPICEGTLNVIAESQGYEDINVFINHLDGIEANMGGRTDYDEESHHDAGIYSGIGKENANEYGFSNQMGRTDEEFVVDDKNSFRIQGDIHDEEYLLYSVDWNVFPFSVLSRRLVDMRKLMDQNVITREEFEDAKMRILNDIITEVKMECMDCYEVLDVPYDVGEEGIKKAFRKLAVQYHPDKISAMGPKLKEIAHQEMKKLNYAKETLLDPDKRSEHDLMLRGK